eukprot:scaffold39920_cov18-Phaeocystis_antarctica.AAC.1
MVYLDGAGCRVQGRCRAAAWMQGAGAAARMRQGLQPGYRGCSLGTGAAARMQAGAAARVQGLQPGCRGIAAWVQPGCRGCRQGGCSAPLGELDARQQVALAHDHVELHLVRVRLRVG